MARTHLILQKNLTRLFTQRRVIAAVVLLVALGGVFELANVTNFLSNTPRSTRDIVTAGSPVEPPKQQATVSQEKTPTSNATRSIGGAIDTRGRAGETNPSQWTTSKSGLITVKQPSADAKIQDGSTISGSAKVKEIHYRLIDNVVGVVAQGTLNVVDGNFSGILKFQPNGTGGRLDVFSTDAQGVEYNEVQINVSF